LAAFSRARSAELEPARERPPRFLALHSSAALAVNVFEHWANDAATLLAALEIDGRAAKLTFEEPFPTGLDGDPPYIDVAITLDTGTIIAIESKFTEWLQARPSSQAAFKQKYFPASARLWARSGLPKCQALAEGIQARHERFKFLHAAQLLKQALALASRPAEFVLYYVHYDHAGRESRTHRDEIERFRGHVGEELRFRALSYQDLFRRLRAAAAVDREYLEYLKARYFGDVA
jgi:hypothetical protein